jgi:serine phosphatase RsbU (regulator of sigma subunit)
MAPDPESARGAQVTRSPFELHWDALIHAWTGHIALFGGLAVPAFLLLDWVTMPAELLGRFAVYRGVVTFIVFVQYFVIRHTAPRRYSFLHGYFFTLVVGGMIAWMTVDLGGFDSAYYAGLNLVVAANLLLPWRAIHSLLNSVAVLTMYVVLNLTVGGHFHSSTLVNNLFFLGSFIVAAVATSSAKYRLIQNEFMLRAELVEANGSLERSRRELKAARDALWGEMEVAKRIQTSLLPQNRRVGSYDVAARMVTADEVGGDYYDIIELGEDRSWVAIGDVSGHGVESGLVMMMTQTSILSLVHENPALSPAQVFREVNGVLNENISRLRAARYMTLNVVRLRGDGLTLAGKHQDVLVWRRATGAVETISNEGCWIGVVEDTAEHVANLLIPMAEGDVALFFTDGATEAMNGAGEMFGEGRLTAMLARVADRPLDEALQALFAEVAAFHARQDDDITMMLVRKSREAVARGQVEPGPARSSAA